jgi:sugar lactone lactonase YvrE
MVRQHKAERARVRISRVGDVRCQVGEGPLWDERTRTLYFVDLVGRKLWRFAPGPDTPDQGSFDSWAMPDVVAALALTEAGGIVVALGSGFFGFDQDTEELSVMAVPQLAENTQFNDGKVDRQGRFIGVTMERTMKLPEAAIYRLNGRAAEKLDGGYIIGNGPCWSQDGCVFYCSDSIAKEIYAYRYDPVSGAVADRRVFASTAAFGGIPDGATVDADGRLWMAVCGAGKVVAFAPDGSATRVIDMPTAFVSSVMFGGPDLDTLYVTSLDPTLVGLPPDPASGYLYAITDLDARGLIEPRMQ